MSSECGRVTKYSGQIIAVSDSIIDFGGCDTVRFGRMYSGEIAVKQVWIDNKTSRVLVIKSYDTNCGCSSLDFDNKPIVPNDKGRVSFVFDSRGEHGWQMKLLEINFAETPTPLKIYIEAEVQ